MLDQISIVFLYLKRILNNYKRIQNSLNHWIITLWFDQPLLIHIYRTEGTTRLKYTIKKGANTCFKAFFYTYKKCIKKVLGGWSESDGRSPGRIFFFCQINFEWTYGILVVTAGELKDFYSSFILLNELFRVFLFVI